MQFSGWSSFMPAVVLPLYQCLVPTRTCYNPGPVDRPWPCKIIGYHGLDFYTNFSIPFYHQWFLVYNVFAFPAAGDTTMIWRIKCNECREQRSAQFYWPPIVQQFIQPDSAIAYFRISICSDGHNYHFTLLWFPGLCKYRHAFQVWGFYVANCIECSVADSLVDDSLAFILS